MGFTLGVGLAQLDDCIDRVESSILGQGPWYYFKGAGEGFDGHLLTSTDSFGIGAQFTAQGCKNTAATGEYRPILPGDADDADSIVETWLIVGTAILTGGMALFCLGLVTLGVYLMRGRRQGVPGRDLAKNTLMTLLLLMVNFPAALACIWVAGDSIGHVRLHLVNESTTVVENLNITWPGGEKYIGDLDPLGRGRVSFLVSGDGSVDFTARQGGEPCEGNLIGYVTPNMGETDDVAFLGDCQVSVEMR